MGSDSTSKFPAAYVNTVKEDDSVVIRVDQNKGEIGSRASGMPGSLDTSGMEIKHVGGEI